MRDRDDIFIDINTRMLPDRHNIYFARPGKAYKLYKYFVENNAIIADLPGLELEQGKPASAHLDLNRRIHRSRAIRKWHHSGSDTPAPSRNLNDYSNALEDGGTTQLRTAVIGFLERAEVGDLILVTPSTYEGKAIVGEITKKAGDYSYIKADALYADDVLIGRDVKWLGSVDKKMLSKSILDIAHKPNAFVLLPRSVREELYRIAYASYIFGGSFYTRFDVRESTFKSRDDLVIQAFFNMVAANTAALIENKSKVLFSIGESVFRDSGDYAPDLRTSISSPGHLSLSSFRVTPHVAAALLAIAIALGPSAVGAAEGGKIKIGNSQAADDDPCVALIFEMTVTQIKLLGLEKWPEACQRAREVEKRTGLQGPARVKQ